MMDVFKGNDRESEKKTITRLQDLMKCVKEWMDSNRLKMNDCKTEFILFGSLVQLQKCHTCELNVNRTMVKRSKSVKYLGATLDENLTLKHHITKKCQIAMFNIQRIKNIRRWLTMEAAKSVVQALVLSHLDYANSILYGLPKCDMKRLQRVQNIAAKLVLQRSKYDSSTQARKDLHWLPVEARIEFKILCTVHKCLHDRAPLYLISLFVKHRARPGLRSADKNLLRVPKTVRKTFADRSISVSGPVLWNSLDKSIRDIEDHELFRQKLKTILFKKYYCC
jgi:hypothetical protein